MKKNIVDHKIFVVEVFSSITFSNENLNTRNILCNVRQPILILVAKVWRRNLDYAKNLQAKYFTGENIPIYGNRASGIYTQDTTKPLV